MLELPAVRRLAFPALVLLAAGCAASPGSDPAVEPESSAAELAAPAAVGQALRQGQPQRLILLLDDAPAAAARREAAGLSAGEATAAASASLERTKDGLLASADAAELTVLHRYPSLPALHVEVRTQAALARLLLHGEVLRAVEDAPQEAFLAQSLPQIHQPAAAAAGSLGQGTAVAVLDTGVDYTRADFGSCSAPGAPGCRVAYAQDFATSDGALDANGHGTNVAAIVAGVAPGAAILALDVFDGAYAYSSDILAAIDWCVRNQATYNIVALNMSLGSGGSTTTCGSDVFAGAVRTARAAGILTAAASGNNGYTNRISTPACTPDAVSVGAVYDSSMGGISYSACTDASTAADKVTCFSNSASFLTVLAPGALITAGGYTMAGTSQASPHVAGAVAVYRSAAPTATPDQVVAFLRSGPAVTDPRNGIAIPRIDLAATPAPGCALVLSPGSLALAGAGASGTLSVSTGDGCSWSASTAAAWLTLSPSSGRGPGTVTVTAPVNVGVARNATVVIGSRAVTASQAKDASLPTGGVAILGPSPTTSRTVALHVIGSDPAGVPSMCLSNTSRCTAWKPFAADVSWALASGGAGVRTVYLWLKDGAGNVNGPATAQVLYDATAPAGGVLTAVAGTGSAALSWSGFSDPATGIAGYKLVYAAGSTPPSYCTGGTVLYTGTGTSYQITGLAKGVAYNFRVCATDGAGNVAAGKTRSVRLR
jgi:subtilisin family serine protease